MLECPICYEKYDNKQSKIFLECGHYMCSSCLFEFYKRDKECGFCRHEFKIAEITLLYMLKYAIIKNKDNLFNYAINSINNTQIFDLQNEEGNTLLHIACLYDNKVNEIISRGSNPFILNKKKMIPFDYLDIKSKYYYLFKNGYILRIYLIKNLTFIYIFLNIFALYIDNLFIYLFLTLISLFYTNNNQNIINKFKFTKDIKKFRKEVLRGVIPDKNTIEKIKKLNLEDHLDFLNKAGYL